MNVSLCCPVDLEPLTNAVSLIKCCHKINEPVAKRLFGEILSNGSCSISNQKCPICRKVVESYAVDHSFRELVKNAMESTTSHSSHAPPNPTPPENTSYIGSAIQNLVGYFFKNPSSEPPPALQETVPSAPAETEEEKIARLKNNGDSNAYLEIGLIYKNSRKGVSAREYFQKAAALNNPYGMIELATTESIVKAENLFRSAIPLLKKAANRQDDKAMLQLAIMYENGQGVITDLTEAYSYCANAAVAGNATAKERLPALHAKWKRESDKIKQENEQQMNEMKARILYQQTINDSKLKRIDAMIELAQMYKIGLGVKQNFQRADYWFAKAEALAKRGGIADKCHQERMAIQDAVKAEIRRDGKNVGYDPLIAQKSDKPCEIM